jgi:predicted dithiol-disulfide oxidoreductase (DUF899 family)
VTLHDARFPGESDEYRRERNRLLKAEIELRQAIERVAAQRRALPPGGPVPDDYRFEAADADGAVRFSELFSQPCPSCTSILDGLDGAAPHLAQCVNLAVVAKSDPRRISEFARERGWRNLRLLSSRNNAYNHDYHAETADGEQLPILNVFVREAERIRHFWATELLFAKSPEGEETRHVDLIWPIWHTLDMTPAGRGDEPNFPGLDYP